MRLFGQINYLAVIVTTVIYFGIGAVWYTPLFGKAWQTETGAKIDRTAKFPIGQFVFGMGGQLVSSFVYTVGIAFLLQLNQMMMTQANRGPVTWLSGLFTGAFAAIMFTFPANSGKVFFQNKPKLFWIDFGYNLVGAIVIGVILAVWR